jgi:adenosylcobinamide-GDP ribazoletransferase
MSEKLAFEIAPFLNALRFMTIVPTPPSCAAPESDWLSRCVKYFPLVGIGVGLVSAIVWLLAEKLWGPAIGAVLAVATSIAITGALHEDGLADTADGLGGGWSIEKRLAIMKDSRIGTYGVLALIMGIALRGLALMHLPLWTGAAALIAGHAAARITPLLMMDALSYAGDTASMKVGYTATALESHERWFAFATVTLALLPLAFASVTSVVLGALLGAALAVALGMWARRLIGGYTGDVLGAIEQVFEIGFLLGVALMAR